jgi:hypothetical protein
LNNEAALSAGTGVGVAAVPCVALARGVADASAVDGVGVKGVDEMPGVPEQADRDIASDISNPETLDILKYRWVRSTACTLIAFRAIDFILGARL